MDHQELRDRLRTALIAAREAGEIAVRSFRRQDFSVQLKHDSSPVTEADRAAEEHLRYRLHEAFPDDGILGEELPELPGKSGCRWVLDPIDGTRSFICGVPLWGQLVGLEHGQRSLLGVIHLPVLAETVYAAEGQGAWYQSGDAPPVPAHVSAKPTLKESLFCTSIVRLFDEVGHRAAYQTLQARAWETRTWGDCYGYVLVATGRAEVMVDPKLQVWDCAALQPVIEAAGGRFTDWDGLPTIYTGNGVATNGLVHEEVLSILGRR
jgi:histidinol phosphatase-like enzyme (inositol monophosphatase family)